jgi:calcineurin-like phosphoesterase family protein
MIKQLKFAYPSDMCNLFYVSCLHLGHDRDFLFGPRGFANVVEHDLAMGTRWNETIRPCDIVFSIGDTIFGDGAEERLIEWFNKLNFWKLYLSPGNHLAGWRQLYTKTLKKKLGIGLEGPWAPEFEIYPLEYKVNDKKTVYFMPNLYETYVGNQAVILCHYPIMPHNGAGKGTWGVFGHCHGNLPDTNKETGKGKTLDVCIESFGRPVSYKEIEAIMKTRTPRDVPHHTKSTNYPV